MVDDEIVIELVEKEIQNFESKSMSWIIQGFPRTRVQALSLQRMEIIPDRFICLKTKKNVSLERLREAAASKDPNLTDEEKEEMAQRQYMEWKINNTAVLSTYNQFVYTKDCCGLEPLQVKEDLKRMLSIRFRNNAPRRPPKVLLIGPPGSGRSIQAQRIADTFGLVNISPQKILVAEAERNPPIKMKIKQAQDNGEAIPDEIILRLVDERIRKSDCQVNGWILDGFPDTESQVNLLKSMRITPSLVCMFDQQIDTSIDRLQARRIDPMTGELFNMNINQPQFQAQQQRLQRMPGDAEDLVRRRFQTWDENQTMLEENYKGCLLTVQSERTPESVFETIREAVENPL